jgi:hypothetical protein
VVTGAIEPVVPQHIRQQVEALGGVLDEYQLVGIGADELGDVGAALLVGVGRLLHQLVRAAVHSTIACQQELAFGVEHLQGPLRGGTRIQVGQLISAAHYPFEDGEVRPDLPNIHCGLTSLRDGHLTLRRFG